MRPLRKSLSKGAEVLRFVARTKGGGSLGRPRLLVVASWNSGTGVREAKALVPSAWARAHGKKGRPSHFVELACGVYRSPDATLKIEAGTILRRIAPDTRKIDIKAVKPQGLAPRLLSVMGADLGTIHAALARSLQIKADLELTRAPPGRRHAVSSRHSAPGPCRKRGPRPVALRRQLTRYRCSLRFTSNWETPCVSR